MAEITIDRIVLSFRLKPFTSVSSIPLFNREECPRLQTQWAEPDAADLPYAPVFYRSTRTFTSAAACSALIAVAA